MVKKVTILGSTGSIGKSAVRFLLQHPDEFKVVGLVGGANAEVLVQQAKLLLPEYVALCDTVNFNYVKDTLEPLGIKCVFSENAACEIASIKVDITLAAISGFAGLKPTLAAMRAGNNIGLANKEVLICAGQLFMDEAKKHNVKILPVDSEHSAIFQIFNQEEERHIDNIYLTCSGGPFRNFSQQQLSSVTVQQALNHPRWNMGPKITIDSATLMNKALEKIEAYHLFGLAKEKIKIIIHPESIIHGMLTFIDGSMLAQLSNTDMIIPISYALSWPDRMSTGHGNIDFDVFSALTFFKPDINEFPALRLVENVLDNIQSQGIIFNSANEIAVEAFLNKQIKFLDIYKIIEETLINVSAENVDEIDAVFELDKRTRIYARKQVESLINA